MITAKQLQSLVDDIVEWNYLAFTEQERRTDTYLYHCKAMVEEESETERKLARNPVQELDSLGDTIFVAVQAGECPDIEEDYICKSLALTFHAFVEGERKGYDMYSAVRAIIANNMTKFPLLSEVKDYYGGQGWAESACDWIESQGRYKGIWCEERVDKHGDVRVVFKNLTGKVVKWANYVDVDLSDYIK